MIYRIPFGGLKIGASARLRIAEILESNWISEGRLVREFEEKFAEKFCWKHAIATSSGTDAGIVVWSAVRELSGCGHSLEYAGTDEESPGEIFTPASAFVATVNCLITAGFRPKFIDINLDTLNLDVDILAARCKNAPNNGIGIQFVATMGKPTPIQEIAKIAEEHDLYLIGDWCEAHGCGFVIDESEKYNTPGPRFFNRFKYADHFCDASIYSFYAAHLIIGGEGGIICTDDDELADMCRSIKSHGRPSNSIYFDFQRIGFNSKWNEFCAAVALESLENFDENFAKRRDIRQKLIETLPSMEDKLILYRDGLGEIISPHAFPVVLRDENADIRSLYEYLDKSGIQCKTLFGSLPTQHGAFEFLGHKLGKFLVAERIGRTGLHLPCNEFMTDDDVAYVADRIGEFFRKEKP